MLNEKSRFFTMAEGHVSSLTLLSTKRIIEVATQEECNEIRAYTVKRQQVLTGAKLRDALRALEHLAPFADLIDTVSIMEGKNTSRMYSMISFEFDSEMYHLDPGCSHTTVVKSHSHDGPYRQSTYYQRNGSTPNISISGTDRPLNPAHLGRFILWIEALAANEAAFGVIKQHTKRE
jgi:hypothetical protein